MHEFKTKTVFVVDGHELEEIINKEYGFNDYSIVASEEIGNDVSLDWNVDGDVDDYDRVIIDQRKEQWSFRAYINDLADRGIIPKGDYVIDTSW